jgi:cytochrome c biogenesis protein CcmG, thiol:disulfide interchange protein DsbE
LVALYGGSARQARQILLVQMRRYALPAVISLIVVALLAVLAFGVSKSGPSNVVAGEVQAGKTPVAPNSDMRLALLGTGQKETLKDLRGKVVMVNVFAGWCIACQDEVKQIKHAQHVLAQHGGEVVGVTYQDSSSDAQGYLSTYHLNFPVLLDPGDTFVQPYGVSGVPETFFIDKAGHVVAANTAQMSSKWLDKTLNRVLGIES